MFDKCPDLPPSVASSFVECEARVARQQRELEAQQCKERAALAAASVAARAAYWLRLRDEQNADPKRKAIDAAIVSAATKLRARSPYANCSTARGMNAVIDRELASGSAIGDEFDDEVAGDPTLAQSKVVAHLRPAIEAAKLCGPCGSEAACARQRSETATVVKLSGPK